jgi:hypothetical protein
MSFNTPVRDLAGLLQRIAELEPLCADPRVRRAVATGNPFKVYRALFWARLLRRLPQHRRTLDVLLANRRAFARPLGGKLWLGTVNSFGASLVGSAEAEPDGTHIATHAVVIAFAVPLFPLGAYVVAGGERNGLSSSWRIFARVPLGTVPWLWSRGVALAGVVAIALGAASALHARGHHALHVLNGFPVPVHARVGAVEVDVPANGRKVIDVPTGVQPARAVAGDLEVDALDLRVDAGGHVALWNVAGAAPLFREDVIYSARKGADIENPHRIHCAERQIRFDRVDDLFKDPPGSVDAPEHGPSVTRRHVDLLRSKGLSGAEICAQVLAREGRDRDALAVIEAQARVGGWDVESGLWAARVAMGLGPADAERVFAPLRAAHPDDVAVHRAWQDYQADAGREAAILAEYRARAEAAPTSGDAAYLHLRLLRGQALADAVERTLPRFPQHPFLLRLAIIARAEVGDWDGAIRAFDALRVAAPAECGSVLYEVAVAEVEQGRPRDALARLRDAWAALDEGERRHAAVLHARVAAVGNLPDGRALLSRLDAPSPDPILRLHCGEPVDEKGLAPAAKVVALARRDPAAALAAAGKLTPGETGELDVHTWALVYGEAARTGARVAAALARYAPAGRARELAGFVRGEGVLASRLPLEVRAAAYLVRARDPALGAAERARLLDEAGRLDPLQLLTEARASWRPSSGAR